VPTHHDREEPMVRPKNAVELDRNRWGVPNGAGEDGLPLWQMLCSRCWEPRNCCWGDGLCLDCYEYDLLPIGPEGVEETGESWSDVYVDRNYDLD
jgi:hypothetical protein